ncbi:MAG TPA: lipid A deacylase LpxR family protein [Chitinophagaceae bacterium]|nr:lipid A deacylase LpxR family protein [Chitinophagaceae bacterium]
MAVQLSRNKIVILFVALFFSLSSWAQQGNTKTYSQQLSVTTENDRYMLQGRDGYYTNGLLINYTRAHSSKKQTVLKQIDQYEIGQKLYTPYSRKIYSSSQIDRPVTGYLYLKFSQSVFLQHNQFWQWGASAGAIGDASLGRGMQNTFHKLINVNSDWWGWIWDYQLKSEVGLNLQGSYARGLLQDPSFLQITPVSQATLGTNFTNISQGLFLQIGRFNSLSQSAYWNASVQDRKTAQPIGKEIFFYYHPEVMYQLYNATVQGGMFVKDKGPITSSIEPFVFTHHVGAACAWNRYTLKLEAVFQSREAGSQLHGHQYGSIQGSYRFH